MGARWLGLALLAASALLVGWSLSRDGLDRGLSAIGAYVEPNGELVNTQWSNGGTFLGAVCFLIASVLTLGEGPAAAGAGGAKA